MDGAAAGTLLDGAVTDVGRSTGTDAPPTLPISAAGVEKPENHKRPWSEAHVIYLIHEALAGKPYERLAEVLERHGEGVRNKLHKLLSGAETCPDAAADDLIALRKRMKAEEQARTCVWGFEKVEGGALIEQYRRMANLGAQVLARANAVMDRLDLVLSAVAVLASRVSPGEINPVGRMLAGHVDSGHLARLIATINGVADPVTRPGYRSVARAADVYESTETVGEAKADCG